MAKWGGVASGHEQTTNAAMEILRGGGNAFDAAIAAFCAACVCEPVLASLGGGGFLLAHPVKAKPKIFDFFVQTPMQRQDQAEFLEIQADFGNTVQHFHIGMGSVATPGAVRGIFYIHRHLGHMPLKDIFQPAIHLAKQGVKVSEFQAYVFTVIQAILRHDADCFKLYRDPAQPQELLKAGQDFYLTDFADLLENLAIEGEDLFYRGEVAKSMLGLIGDKGGHLTAADMQQYQCRLREPLEFSRGTARIFTNPGPSSGGLLIAFALRLLAKHKGPHDVRYWEDLVKVMDVTNQARQKITQGDTEQFDATLLNHYQKLVNTPWVTRGTTHISVMDKHNNLASLSLSNGEGCGYIIPGTGIMLNNMLGEEDLHPQGFNQWPCNTRMTSMLAPSMIIDGQTRTAVGSGGSNRLRTAILQVMVNLLDFGMALEPAITAPRIHYENQELNVEPGLKEPCNLHLKRTPGRVNFWPQHNLYFGGTHCVQSVNGEISAFGDERRNGVGKTL